MGFGGGLADKLWDGVGLVWGHNQFVPIVRMLWGIINRTTDLWDHNDIGEWEWEGGIGLGVADGIDVIKG